MSLDQCLDDRDQDTPHDDQRNGDRQAFVAIDSHLESPLGADGRSSPPDGGVVQETDGMTKLVGFGGLSAARGGQMGEPYVREPLVTE